VKRKPPDWAGVPVGVVVAEGVFFGVKHNKNDAFLNFLGIGKWALKSM